MSLEDCLGGQITARLWKAENLIQEASYTADKDRICRMSPLEPEPCCKVLLLA